MTNFSSPNPPSVGVRGYPSVTPPPSISIPGGPLSSSAPSPNSMPPTSINSGYGAAAAAAAAAILAAANNVSRYPSPGQSPLEQQGQPYMGSQELMLGSKGPLTGNNTPEGPGSVSSGGVPSIQDVAMMGNVETGQVDLFLTFCSSVHGTPPVRCGMDIISIFEEESALALQTLVSQILSMGVGVIQYMYM